MTRRWIHPCTAIAVAAAIAGTAAAAPAATIRLDKACYVVGAPITVTGAGFAPGQAVALRSTAGISAVAPANAAGAISVTLAAPKIGTSEPAARAFTLTASSGVTGAPAAARLRIATFAVTAKPTNAPLGVKVRFAFSGFAAGRAIYGHYLLGGKLRLTTRYGVAHGPCGTLAVRKALYPGPNPRYGLYQVQFDSRWRYTSSAVPKLVDELNIFKRSSSAS